MYKRGHGSLSLSLLQHQCYMQCRSSLPQPWPTSPKHCSSLCIPYFFFCFLFPPGAKVHHNFTKTAQARKQGGGREGWREGGKEPGSLFLSIQILSADKIAEVEYALQWNWCLTPIGVGSLSMSFVVCCLVFVVVAVWPPRTGCN